MIKADKTEKFIIDTDIGDDVDDAFAVSLAVKAKADLIGITTVYKNTVKRATLLNEYLKILSVNIPVYAGYKETISDFTPDWHSDILEAVKEDELIKKAFDQEAAVDFLVTSAKKYGKDLTIICLGPLTNIAKAFIRDEAVMKSVKFVMMGGAYYTQYIDWNVFCDVAAAKIVFDKAENLTAIGAEVTHLLEVPEEILQKFLERGGKLAEKLSDDITLWRGKNTDKKVVLHDPLAVYYALTGDLVKTESIKVNVVTNGYFYGMTENLSRSKLAEYSDDFKNKLSMSSVTVAESVNAEMFIKNFFEILSSED